jgi:DNA repair protein RecO (recombination protein O)
MQWTDEGIVLGMRRLGEGNAVLELLTREHGRHLGLVRGGAGSRLRPTLQPGNSVKAVWRARLDEHLGTYTVEGLDLCAGTFLAHAHALYGITHVSAIVRLLPERDPHAEVFAAVEHIVRHLLDVGMSAALIARFELAMLTELGFGLDLDSCAATGGTTDLVYVSPKSGRAVSREAGAPWHDKLLHLPPFLRGQNQDGPSLIEEDIWQDLPSAREIEQCFALTGVFLARHIFEPRGLDIGDARRQYIAAVMRAMPDAA